MGRPPRLGHRRLVRRYPDQASTSPLRLEISIMSALDHHPRYQAFMPPDGVDEDTVPVRRAPESPDIADDTLARSALNAVKVRTDAPETVVDSPPMGVPQFVIPAPGAVSDAPTQDLPMVSDPATEPVAASDNGVSAARSVRTPWAAAVIGLVAIAALLGGIFVLRSALLSPTAVVSDYLDALVEGDARRALELSASTTKDADSLARQALRNYRHISGRPTDFSIVDTEEEGSSALVTAKVTQDGLPYTVEFSLHKDPTAGGILDRWVLDAGLERPVTITLTSERAGVSSRTAVINGGEVQSTTAGEITQTILPGMYAVDGPQRGRYFDYGETQTFLAGVQDDSHAVTLAERPTKALEDDARRVAQDILDQCLTTLAGKGCPNQPGELEVPLSDVEKFTWTPTAEKFELDPASLSLTYSAKLSLWYTYPQEVTQYNSRIWAWETVTRYESVTVSRRGSVGWLISIDPARESLSLAHWD